MSDDAPEPGTESTPALSRRRLLKAATAVAAIAAAGALITRCDDDDQEPEPSPSPPGEDQAARLVRLVEEAAATGDTVELTGTTLVTSRLVLSSSGVRLRGARGATLQLANTSIGCEIAPAESASAPTGAAAIGSTTLPVRGGGWAPDEWAGCWVEILDPSASPGRMSRRIVASTSTDLELEHPLGRDVPDGCTARILRPLDEVVIEDLELARRRAGGTNLLIQYCRSVRLSGVTSAKGGQADARRGNGISIQHCDRVDVLDTTTTSSGNFGLFVYDCDDVTVEDYRAVGWGGQFGAQLKDCRRGVIRRAECDADGTTGDNGISLKCSGLNPASRLSAEDCVVRRSRLASFEFSSITNEGTQFSGEDFTFSRCRAENPRTHGFNCVLDGVSTPTGWTWRDCTATGAGRIGFTRPAADHLIEGCTAEGSGAEGLTITSRGVRVTGGEYGDNCRNPGRKLAARSGSEILVDAADVLIEDVTFTRTSGGGAQHAVRSTGAARTVVKGCTVDDPSAGYVSPFAVKGKGSRVES